MQIINTNLITKPIARRRITNRIVVHHTAGSDHSAAEIHRMHLKRGFAGIGYHYIIRQNGTIEVGREESLRGAHAGKANADSIGIGLTGNFEKRVPTTAQMDALVWLVGDIRHRLGQQITVVRHRDVAATACPGRLFPWDGLMEKLSGTMHTVVAGDTLWSIARRHNVTLEQLCQWNNLQTDKLHIGQHIQIWNA